MGNRAGEGSDRAVPSDDEMGTDGSGVKDLMAALEKSLADAQAAIAKRKQEASDA